MSRVIVKAWPAIEAAVVSTLVVLSAIAVPALIMYAVA